MRAFAVLLVLLCAAVPARAENPMPYSGTEVVDVEMPFDAFVDKLKAAIKANKMGIVAEACAHCGAKAVLDKTIAKNRVIMIYHPRFAVRMLEASVASGIEAPIRLYVTEEATGTRLTYRRPSSVFAPYEVKALDDMATELDAIFAAIVDQATR